MLTRTNKPAKADQGKKTTEQKTGFTTKREIPIDLTAITKSKPGGHTQLKTKTNYRIGPQYNEKAKQGKKRKTGEQETRRTRLTEKGKSKQLTNK